MMDVSVDLLLDTNFYLTKVGFLLLSNAEYQLIEVGVRFDSDSDVHLMDFAVLIASAFGRRERHMGVFRLKCSFLALIEGATRHSRRCRHRCAGIMPRCNPCDGRQSCRQHCPRVGRCDIRVLHRSTPPFRWRDALAVWSHYRLNWITANYTFCK